MRRLLVAVALGALAVIAGCTDGEGPRTVEALYGSTLNVFEGSEVRVRGVKVGEVTDIAADGLEVRVTMEVDHDVELPADVRAVIRQSALITDRFVDLTPAYAGGATLADGAEIPRERTSKPAEVDEVLASLDGLLEEVDAETVGDLVGNLAGTLEGQGAGLNTLVAEASGALDVLADARDEVTGGVRELGLLTETVATRREQLGPLLGDLATVTETIAEEGDELVDGLGELRRLNAAIGPILERHDDALVDDLASMSTTLSTVERNTERIAQAVGATRLLFEAGGRAFDYERAILRLHNHSTDLEQMIADRLTERLVGLCLRLEVEECAAHDFWEPHLPDLVCLPDYTPCEEALEEFPLALGAALGSLPEEAQEGLAADADDEPATEDEDTDAEATPSLPRADERDRRPAPDPPDIPSTDHGDDEGPLLRERVSRLFGGRR